jgi:hypothetical protein
MPECFPRKECESKTLTAAITGYAPVQPPSGLTTDKIARIYTAKEDIDGTTYSGKAQRLVFESFGATDTREEFIEEMYFSWTAGNGTDPPYYLGGDYQYTSYIDDECGDEGFTYIGDNNKNPYDVEYEYGDETETCEESEHLISTVGTSTSGTELALQGCPGPFEPAGATYYWDFEEVTAIGVRLTGGRTETEFIEDGIASIPPIWPGTLPGTQCVATTDTDWPTIGEVAATQDGGIWPPCEDDNPPPTAASADLIPVRYRYGIPSGFAGSVWEMEWDEVKASKSWWAWFDDGATGIEPSPGPTLVAHRSWDWAGDTGAPWSSWFELMPPEYPGETRTANVLAICYRSTRLGVKPTASGDQVVIPP